MLSKPLQSSVLIRKRISYLESVMIAATSVKPEVDQFLGTLLLVPQKDENQRPVINLKKLNQFISYQHFKMKGLPCLKEFLSGLHVQAVFEGCLFL